MRSLSAPKAKSSGRVAIEFVAVLLLAGAIGSAAALRSVIHDSKASHGGSSAQSNPTSPLADESDDQVPTVPNEDCLSDLRRALEALDRSMGLAAIAALPANTQSPGLNERRLRERTAEIEREIEFIHGMQPAAARAESAKAALDALEDARGDARWGAAWHSLLTCVESYESFTHSDLWTSQVPKAEARNAIDDLMGLRDLLESMQ